MDDELPDHTITVTFTSHDPRPLTPSRPLTPWERAAIGRILSRPFESRENALRQVSGVTVEAECSHCPTIWLRIDPQSTFLITASGHPTQGIAPCELHGRDLDGMPFQILLHIDAGILTMLDAYRGDGETFLALPDVARAELVCE